MATFRILRGKHQAIIRRSGYPQQSKTFPTKKLAQEWARDIESKMDRGIFMDQSNAKSTTLDDLIEIYLKEVTLKKRSENSIDVDSCTIRRIQREERNLCSMTMDKIKPHHFNTYRDKRLSTLSPYMRREDGTLCNISASAVKRELTLLSCIIKHKFIDLGLPYNPACGEYVKRPSVNDARDVRLCEEDKQRLVDACYRVRNSLIGPFLEMGFETGARRGEIISLKWADVDIENRTALLRDVKNTKNPDKIKNRNIGLSLRAAEVLKSLPQDDEFVFPMTANAFKLSFKRIRKKLDMSYFHFHDARHEFISRMVEAGVDSAIIMAQVGHTSTKSLQRYMTIQPTHLRACGVVKEVVEGSPKAIWEDYGHLSGISAQEFDAYYAGSDTACALVFSQVNEITLNLTLSTLRSKLQNFHPPQFFKYLRQDSKELQLFREHLYASA